MRKKSRSLVWLSLLFIYIILQFLWWEVLLVKQTGQIIAEKQNLAALSSTNQATIINEVQKLHKKKTKQVIMIVGEGTVFLLLLLFGIYKIKQAHDREVKLNEQHQNFLLSITHELKTPLSAIKLQLQTLQRHQLQTDKKEELLKNALDENERLNSLIDNVLYVSRMDTQQTIVKLQRIQLSELVNEVLQRYFKLALNTKILNAVIEPNIEMNADALVFPSVLINLIDNAFKYSFDEKQVQVILKKEKNTIYISVSDLGCGIAEVDKPNVFERFYRSGSEETRQAKGTGLGLYIVHYVVKAHGGQISILNNTPKGTCFQLTFPTV